MRERWGVSGRDIVILVAGRLVTDKGHADLIAACAAPREVLGNVRVVIVGDGPREHVLAAAVRAARLEESVRMVGFHGDMAAVYRAADIYCQPSLREGLPNSVLEAMSCGLPVVATAVDGTPEAVEDGVTGFLVPPRSPRALAAALNRMVTNEALRRSCGGAGRKRLESRFSIDGSISQWETLLSREARVEDLCAVASSGERPDVRSISSASNATHRRAAE